MDLTAQPPLHLWNECILSGIENNIGKYIKMDSQTLEERIFTFARICVDVDLNKGLSDCIQLIHKQMNWTQNLDYENTTFRCRICKQTGHLQNICPEAKKNNLRRKKNGKQQKGWNFFPSQQEMEEDEAEVDLPFPRNNQTSQAPETQESAQEPKETKDN